MQFVGRRAEVWLDERVRVFVEGAEVIRHEICREPHRTVQHEGHWAGLKAKALACVQTDVDPPLRAVFRDPLCRSLDEYEAVTAMAAAT